MKLSAPGSQREPNPTINNNVPLWNLVLQDMKERDETGRRRYGTPLRTFNGRRALVDAYQEALDLVVYLRQEIEEREASIEAVRQIRDCLVNGDSAKALNQAANFLARPGNSPKDYQYLVVAPGITKLHVLPSLKAAVSRAKSLGVTYYEIFRLEKC